VYPCAHIAAGHELHHIADSHERYGIQGLEDGASALYVTVRAEAAVSEGRVH
jgi:hypothetical protein